MSLFSFSCFLTIFSTSFLFSTIISPPIENASLYDKFIDFLVKNNCTMPEEIDLPFPSSSQSPYNYLSSPLKECQSSNAVEEYNEARFLCSEIFEVLGNITCTEYDKPLPKIKAPLSQDICNDFKSMKSIFPKGDDHLSGKLADDTLCKVLCSKDFEFLCKTLLWSYDVQTKIKSSLENNAKVKEKTSMDENTASKIDTSIVKVNIAEDTPVQESNKEIKDNKINVEEKAKTSYDVSKLNSVKSSAGNPETVLNEVTSDENATSTNNALNESMKTISMSNGPYLPQNGSEFNEKISDTQPVQSNQNSLSKNINPKQNEVNVLKDDSNAKGINNIPVKSDKNVNSLTSEINKVTNKDEKDIPLNNSQDKKKSTAINSDKTSINSDAVVSPVNVIDNDLNNVDIEGGQNEIKQTNEKNDKEVEKPQLTDFETPLGSSDVDLKQSESTTLQILLDKDEDIEHQEDKEQEQYNDTENEGDYPKSEYDNSFNPPEKNKESSVKSSAPDGSDQMSNSYDTFISSRNNIGRVPDDIPMIPSFPEQEDSHFFFYFLSIVFILMAGYLIFHNKQKIIALIVEGRHERRRRSHGAGYKKLETK